MNDDLPDDAHDVVRRGMEHFSTLHDRAQSAEAKALQLAKLNQDMAYEISNLKARNEQLSQMLDRTSVQRDNYAAQSVELLTVVTSIQGQLADGITRARHASAASRSAMTRQLVNPASLGVPRAWPDDTVMPTSAPPAVPEGHDPGFDPADAPAGSL